MTTKGDLLDIFDKIEQIFMALERVEEKIDALAPPAAVLDPADLDSLDVLLPSIAEALDDETFSVAALKEGAERTGNRAVLHAMAQVGSTKALGQLFARTAGYPVAGLMVTRMSPLGATPALWKIVRT